MKLMAFSIYDEKAEFFSNPFYLAATGMATRMMSDLTHDPNTTISKHPEDFTLYQVGTWDNTTAKFETLATPKFIVKATDEMLQNGQELPIAEAK